MEKGTVVKSKAGKDKGQFYVVVGNIGDRVYVSNGKRRKLNNPKSKNPVHLAITSKVVELPQSDKQLRNLLKDFGGVTKED